MSNKSLLKVVVALGLLAAVLIFLGVNFVPRINASVSGNGNSLVAQNQTRVNYVDEYYPRAMVPQLSTKGSDWVERHPPTYYDKSDWIERHPAANDH